MKRKLLSIFLTTALTVSVLAGCGGSGDGAVSTTGAASDSSASSDTSAQESTGEESKDSVSDAAEEPVTLRTLAWNSMVGHLDSVLAYSAGYYEQEGLNIEMNYINDNPANIQALLEDKADLVSAGATAVLNYIDGGSDIVIIGGQMSLAETLYALPERADEFKELNEETLAGKTIGVTRLNTGDIVFRKILRDRGVDLSKITFVELNSQPDVVEAVVKGEVDLGIAFLTNRQTAEIRGLTPISYLDAEDEWPGFICCRMFTMRDKLEANRDAYVKAMKANIKAYALIQQDRAAATEYALKELETDADTFNSQVYEYGHLGLNPNPDVKNTSEFFQAMVDIGYSEGNVDIKDYIDATVYQDALAELLEEDPTNEIYLELQADDKATNY